ncbi:hypothetical protein BJ322DRAFT_354554 [Thelephora terrestris]|uniref:Secreted protein n=1 Tax=Thelephora terrestris TaxID=56493 RepID=A0A9P6L2H5_9AGAM|nr:hypothetical protein BJ322DRAFT_354554 [Thelephora terrestris]
MSIALLSLSFVHCRFFTLIFALVLSPSFTPSARWPSTYSTLSRRIVYVARSAGCGTVSRFFLWRQGVFCRERSERYRDGPVGDAERVAMAGESVRGGATGHENFVSGGLSRSGLSLFELDLRL